MEPRIKKLNAVSKQDSSILLNLIRRKISQMD